MATTTLPAAASIEAAASESEPSHQRASLTLTSTASDKGSGLNYAIDYRNPDDPEAKPAPVRRFVSKLPPGASYDLGVPEQCLASDAELTQQGGASCPPASKVGQGVLEVDTGFPEPGRYFTADTEVFNTSDGFVTVNTVRGYLLHVVLRFSIDGRKVRADNPRLPGSGAEGGALDSVSIEIFNVQRDGQRYITTPSRCPSRGYWQTRLRFSYDGGVSELTKTPTPCRR